MGNGSKPVDYFYEKYMPSRTFECACYCTRFMSAESRARRGHGAQNNRGSSGACASTFVVDDELEQTISVLQSVNMRTAHYTAVEVGSRQGQWVLKAAQLARRAEMGFESVHGRSIELQEEWKRRQARKISMNGLDDVVTLSPQLITAANYPLLVRNLTMRTGSWQPVNHMDWDCQGCEGLLASNESRSLFEENILSLFIAVHSDNHDALWRTYKDYALLDTGKPNYRCDHENAWALQEYRGAQTSDMRGCLRDSPFGPVYYRDGTLRLFNRRLFERLGIRLRLPSCPPWRQG